MAVIGLQKASISSIRRQIEKMRSETESAEKKIRSALNGLDFEVASKQNIRNCLNNLVVSASKQGDLSAQYKNVFLNVTNSVVESDGKFGNQSQSIFDRIKKYAEGVLSDIKDFFIRNKIEKYAVVAGLFLISPGLMHFSATFDFLNKVVEWLRKIFGVTSNPSENNSPTGVNISTDTNDSKSDGNQAETSQTGEKDSSEDNAQQPEKNTSAFEPTNYEPTDDLLRFVGAYEGFSSTIYVCPAGKDTVGYGHVIKNETERQMYANGITEAQALELMRQDMQGFNNSLKRFVTNNNIQLTQCQYDALLSFSFNCGSAWMTNGSGLSKLLINGEFDKVGAKLGEYVKGGGRVLPGLVNRRADETEMFNNGDYIRNH